jgi:hypothetical protein
MKKHTISILTISTAIAIIVVLGWAEHIEIQNFEKIKKMSPPSQLWEYGGGRWTDAVAMMLSFGIIVSQIYAISKTRKNTQ